jgi:seryl-tRNA synthetase
MEQSKAAKARIAELEAAEKEAGAARDAALLPIGNIVHDSVPVSDDEANNAVVREWGEQRREPGLLSHYDLVQMLDIVNLESGTAVRAAGGGAFFVFAIRVC